MLTLVITLMTGATTLIGVLPTYATVGALAPWLLTFLRVLQGLSAGGEFGGAVSVLTEFAPPGRRGLYGSWQSFTVALELLGGAGAAALLATVLTENQLGDCDWRLPFLLTLPLGLGVIATVLANLGFAVTIVPAGWLSDRFGRRSVMLTGAVLVVVLAVPLLNLLQDPGVSLTVKGAAVCGAGAVVGLMAGPGPAMLAELFPTNVRHTGLGLAYALSNAVFSGCAGLIITETIERTGNVDIPAYYAAATCAVSVLALAGNPKVPAKTPKRKAG